MINIRACAKVYENIEYDGWMAILPETSQGSFFEDPDKDNEVSSVKIRPGCTLKGYDGKGQDSLIFTYTNDEPSLFMKPENDRMTSYSCSCQAQGMHLCNLQILFKHLKSVYIIFKFFFHLQSQGQNSVA